MLCLEEINVAILKNLNKINLSPHFTLQEMERSQTAVRHGIINKADVRQTQALTDLCVNVLEPLRALVGKSINIQSGFRNPTVNSFVGGSSTSQHMKGQAADINVEGMTPTTLFDLIRNSTIPYECIKKCGAITSPT